MALHHRLIGKAARIYWRLTKPRTIGVRAVLLDSDDRVALVRHTYTDQWYLPGGGVKKGESMEAALRRELEEELQSRILKSSVFWASITAAARRRTIISSSSLFEPAMVNPAPSKRPILQRSRKLDGFRSTRYPHPHHRRRSGV